MVEQDGDTVLGPLRRRIVPYLDQGGSAALRRWPGVSAGLCPGRPARRTPGHASPGSADQGGSAGNHRVQRRAVFPWLPVVQVAASRQWQPYRAVARAVLDRQVPAITLRDPSATAHPGLPPPDPASMGSAAPRFLPPCCLRGTCHPFDETRVGTPPTPASGWPPGPRRRARHDRGNVQRDSPIPAARQLWIASGWRQARPCPQSNRGWSKCLVNVHAKTGLTPSSSSRVWRLSGNGGGPAGPTGQATDRPVMPEQPDLIIRTHRLSWGVACCLITWV
jgi:hypothetical protein